MLYFPYMQKDFYKTHLRYIMQKSRRLVFFHSELDTLNLFSNQLKQEFENLGYETFEFDLAQSALSLGLLYDFIQDGGVTAMIGFNMPFFGMQLPSGEKVWEVLDIPCINILVDHPYWYHNLLMRTPRTGIVLSIDRNHSHYIERFYPAHPAQASFLTVVPLCITLRSQSPKEKSMSYMQAACLPIMRYPRNQILRSFVFLRNKSVKTVLTSCLPTRITQSNPLSKSSFCEAALTCQIKNFVSLFLHASI